MGCGNCNTCEVSEKRGCGTSSVFNWLYQIDNPASENKNLFEVQFKGDRKEFYHNTKELEIKTGDWVAVQADQSGHDIGRVTMRGDLVALQIKRKKKNDKIKTIYRKASAVDLKKWEETHKKEKDVLAKAKSIIEEFNLEMKLSDVEYQGDGTKATFYYTAEKRVDFRELIREYSKKFSVKIEMRQIGVRQEAAKLGGIGSCGRELCCSTWMTEFPAVNTSAARYQQLSINPQKLSGQCGRLKCCLNFELDTYVDAIKGFPNTKTRLYSKKGEAKFYKMDVFKKKVYYFYKNNPSDMLELTTDRVFKIIELNKKDKFPAKIEEEAVEKKELMFQDGLGDSDINRFNNKKGRKLKRKRK